MKYIYIVIDSQNTILGAFADKEAAIEVSVNHAYFCRISCQEIIV